MNFIYYKKKVKSYFFFYGISIFTVPMLCWAELFLEASEALCGSGFGPFPASDQGTEPSDPSLPTAWGRERSPTCPIESKHLAALSLNHYHCWLLHKDFKVHVHWVYFCLYTTRVQFPSLVAKDLNKTVVVGNKHNFITEWAFQQLRTLASAH